MRQNFILFFPDEMRASALSIYGDKTIRTPNYERLSQEGTTFEQCIVQNPVCTPSRCSLMTGTYVHNAGHRSLWHLLRPHEESLFRYLQEAGYDIGWFGKNDLYSQKYLEELDVTYREKHPYKGPRSKPEPRFGSEDERYHSFIYKPLEHQGGLPYASQDYVTQGIEYLKQHKSSDKPFFLFLPFGIPHPPYYVPEEYYNMYDPNDMTLKEFLSGAKPNYLDLIRQYRNLEKITEQNLKEVKAIYYGMVSYADMLLGKVLDAMEELGLNDNTTIIASSDHGDFAGDYGVVEKWPNAFCDDLVRVPLVIKTPGGVQNHRSKEPVALFDIMQTILELTGIQARHAHFSQSLVPQLHGEPGNPQRYVFSEGGYDAHDINAFESYVGPLRNPKLQDPLAPYYPKMLQQKEHPESVSRTVMIRSSKHKLIRRSQDVNELYDLVQDPDESHNRYNDPTYQEIRHTMEQELLTFYLKTSDTVPYDDDKRNF